METCVNYDKNWIKLIDDAPQICQHFVSLEGEGNAIGEQSLYIRLSYCSAKCTFCDTKFSWVENDDKYNRIDRSSPRYDKLTTDLRNTVRGKNIQRLTITGGEPLAHAKHLTDIVKYINFEIIEHEKAGSIKYFGIESNGAHMCEIRYVMYLLSNLNELYKSYDIDSTLTISPKIDAKTSWYHTNMSQADVDAMYENAFQNLETFVSGTHLVNYKFVYDYTGKYVDTEKILYMIDHLRTKYNVLSKNILLMPLTPNDPLGKDRDEWDRSKYETSRKCIELGVRYSPRLHVDLALD